MSKQIHEVRDGIHGFILFDQLEKRLIDSAPMQRLRCIHQLAMCYQVYPGATHKRFEHSLGVMETATSPSRRTLRALGFITVLPIETWPSPAITVRVAVLTPMMVVPCHWIMPWLALLLSIGRNMEVITAGSSCVVAPAGRLDAVPREGSAQLDPVIA